jgi:hypothetical protein
MRPTAPRSFRPPPQGEPPDPPVVPTDKQQKPPTKP